jgi:hypothetical protein
MGQGEESRMRTAARWGLAAVSAVVLGCQGAQGPKGDPGPPGPQGEAGPSVSINGLDGGTVNGAVSVNGDLIAGGHLLTYPKNPAMASGITPNGCGQLFWSGGTASGLGNGMALFPLRTLSGTPVVLAQIDESGDEAGATAVRIVRPASNRVSFRCSTQADAIHWLAADPSPAGSSWQFPGGLQVEAGVQDLATTTNTGSITFPMPFSQEPVVLLTIEEPGTVGNAVDFARVIQNTTATSFAYLLEANPAAGLKLHWIAMGTAAGNSAPQPWTFTHGRYRWTAGYITNGACTAPCTYNFPSPLLTAPHVFLTVHDTDGVSVPNYARIMGVTPAQLLYRVPSATERINYVILEDLP